MFNTKDVFNFFQPKTKNIKSSFYYCYQCHDEVNSACSRHRELVQLLTQYEYEQIVEKENQKREKNIQQLKLIPTK